MMSRRHFTRHVQVIVNLELIKHQRTVVEGRRADTLGRAALAGSARP